MKLKIVNKRPITQNGLDLYFAITAKQAPINLTSTPVIGTGITWNQSYKLSDLLTGSSNSAEIEVDRINSGRLYVGYGEFPVNVSGQTAPIPNGDQYYGWIEFSCWTADTCVWINLSNVDIVGLPLTLSSNTFSLGYKNSNNDIIKTLMGKFPGCNVDTPINHKIVAPGINDAPYGSFDAYFHLLDVAGAKLAINSDTLSDGTQKTFTGCFDSSIEAINLTSNSGDTFILYYSAFTSDIIYKGDGGTIVYNGVTIPQNRSGKTDDVIATNSVFRNLVIGFNEGYFRPHAEYSDGVNYSINYSYLEPFDNLKELGQNVGNMYADVIHQGSNSYGFAYADSNLKTLIQAPIEDEIVMNIIGDDDVMCYSNEESTSQNCPGWGPVQFAFGQYSEALGRIKVGNCTYSAATAEVGNGSFLPYVSDWVKMEFLGSLDMSGNPNYIWVRPSTLEVQQTWSADTGGVITTGYCLSNGVSLVLNTVSVPAGYKLTWGASNSWNEGAPNAFKP